MSTTKSTSVKFTIPTADLSIFAKKLYVLAKADKESVLTLTAHEKHVVAAFRASVDGSGVESQFEYIFNNAQVSTCGIVSVLSKELAEVSNKFPSFSQANKPHTKELTFIGKPGSLKIKTTVYWNEHSKPSAQQLLLNTVKTPKEVTTSPLDVEIDADSLAKMDNNGFIFSLDMCSFIQGDAVSKDDHGYWFHCDSSGQPILLATDLMMAAKCDVEAEGAVSKINGILGRQVLNTIRAFISGPEEISIRTFKKLIYLHSGNRRMIAPLLKSKYSIDSSIFAPEKRLLGEVETEALTHILSHFLIVNKHPYNKVTLSFEDGSLKVEAGDEGINKADNLPADVESNGTFSVDASFFNSILSRTKKAGKKCKIYLDTEDEERITIVTEDEKASYLVQGLNSTYED